jgi:hypothetical protein
MRRHLAAVGISAVVLSVTVVAPAARAEGRVDHGTRTVGAVGVERTTGQLAAGATLRPSYPASALPVRASGVAKTENPDALRTPRALRSISPSAAVTSAESFDGPGLEAHVFPPDTQGDVGSSQFFITLNTRFRTYTKSGTADGVIDLTPEVFFASAISPLPAPPNACNFASDPHVRFDRLSQRWFIVMIDVPGCKGTLPNRVMVAVSNTATITAQTVWTFFHIAAPAGLLADYPTLGIDANALYIGVNDFSTSAGTFVETDGYVVQKSSVLGAGPIVSTRFTLATGTGAGPFTPQGVDDPYNVDGNGYFIGVDNAEFGKLDLVRISDPGGAPSAAILSLSVAATAFPLLVPHLGNTGGLNGRLSATDDRLFAATMTADGHIWTAHNIGVNASGVASVATRDGSRWYEISPATTPSLVQSGTVFDSASVDPTFYWMPTVAVSGQGVMAIGGSSAGNAARADAWFAGRLPTDPAGATDTPLTYGFGNGAYNPPADPGGSGGRRWGDYSLTRVDPQDNQTMWTIQEYVSGPDTWGVKVARLAAPPPATALATSGPVPQGRASVHVTVTGSAGGGSGWFDPGPGFPQRFAASVGCGAHVNAVTVVSSNELDLDLDTTTATAGFACAITTTNPDGQATTGNPLQIIRYRPDALIKLAAAATYVGNNIYNLTGASQTVTAAKKQGASQEFSIKVQNDGSDIEPFHLAAAGSAPGFTVHYFNGTLDITSAVVAGTFQTIALEPGQAKAYRLVVSVSTSATVGSTLSRLVKATSATDPNRADAVKAVVKVVRFRPDGLIKLSSATTYVGNNVYNLTGTNQTVTAKRKRGTSQSFSIKVQNDGTAFDSFRLHGPGSRTGFAVHYFVGTTDITTKVVAGTYLTGIITPGAAKNYRIVVTVTSSATVGSAPSWLIRATSTHDTIRADAVKAVVKVVAT